MREERGIWEGKEEKIKIKKGGREGKKAMIVGKINKKRKRKLISDAGENKL